MGRFWSSVDHQLKYKQDVENPEEISAKLKECAEVIAQTDLRGAYGKKPLSVAVDELYKGKVKILGENELGDDAEETFEEISEMDGRKAEDAESPAEAEEAPESNEEQ